MSHFNSSYPDNPNTYYQHNPFFNCKHPNASHHPNHSSLSFSWSAPMIDFSNQTIKIHAFLFIYLFPFYILWWHFEVPLLPTLHCYTLINGLPHHLLGFGHSPFNIRQEDWLLRMECFFFGCSHGQSCQKGEHMDLWLFQISQRPAVFFHLITPWSLIPRLSQTSWNSHPSRSHFNRFQDVPIRLGLCLSFRLGIRLSSLKYLIILITQLLSYPGHILFYIHT